jgi:hypothetical protein
MTDEGPDDDNVLMVANSPEQAQVILALLHGSGIEAAVDGDALQDEFGMSQRMMGQIGVTIRVAPDDLARARELVAEAKAGTDDDGEGGSADV